MVRRPSPRRTRNDMLPRMFACILGLVIGIGFGEFCAGLVRDSGIGKELSNAKTATPSPAYHRR